MTFESSGAVHRRTLHDVSKAWLAAAVLLMTLTGAAFSQAGRLGESCDLASQGVKETATFLAFDHELRGALSSSDAGIVALLVKFPLHVNDERGSYYLEDAASLQGRFQDIFPVALRRAVLDQNPRTVFCNYAGIMYGNGEIRIKRTHRSYRIVTVNILASPPFPESTGYRVELACQTDKDRIIIDRVGSASRYRAWHKPHSLLGKPDAEITMGVKDVQGTGPCSSDIWTFTEGTTKVIVDGGLACGPAETPKDAIGRIELATNDRPTVTSWCF
jgi:hypothetical protein